MIWAIVILYAICFINFISQRWVNQLFSAWIKNIDKRLKKLEQ